MAETLVNRGQKTTTNIYCSCSAFVQLVSLCAYKLIVGLIDSKASSLMIFVYYSVALTILKHGSATVE